MTLFDVIEQVKLLLDQTVDEDPQAVGYILVGVHRNPDGESVDAAVAFTLPDSPEGHIASIDVIDRALDVVRRDVPRIERDPPKIASDN